MSAAPASKGKEKMASESSHGGRLDHLAINLAGIAYEHGIPSEYTNGLMLNVQKSGSGQKSEKHVAPDLAPTTEELDPHPDCMAIPGYKWIGMALSQEHLAAFYQARNQEDNKAEGASDEQRAGKLDDNQHKEADGGGDAVEVEPSGSGRKRKTPMIKEKPIKRPSSWCVATSEESDLIVISNDPNAYRVVVNMKTRKLFFYKLVNRESGLGTCATAWVNKDEVFFFKKFRDDHAKKATVRKESLRSKLFGDKKEDPQAEASPRAPTTPNSKATSKAATTFAKATATFTKQAANPNLTANLKSAATSKTAASPKADTAPGGAAIAMAPLPATPRAATTSQAVETQQAATTSQPDTTPDAAATPAAGITSQLSAAPTQAGATRLSITVATTPVSATVQPAFATPVAPVVFAAPAVPSTPAVSSPRVTTQAQTPSVTQATSAAGSQGQLDEVSALADELRVLRTPSASTTDLGAAHNTVTRQLSGPPKNRFSMESQESQTRTQSTDHPSMRSVLTLESVAPPSSNNETHANQYRAHADPAEEGDGIIRSRTNSVTFSTGSNSSLPRLSDILRPPPLSSFYANGYRDDVSSDRADSSPSTHRSSLLSARSDEVHDGNGTSNNSSMAIPPMGAQGGGIFLYDVRRSRGSLASILSRPMTTPTSPTRGSAGGASYHKSTASTTGYTIPTQGHDAITTHQQASPMTAVHPALAQDSPPETEVERARRRLTQIAGHLRGPTSNPAVLTHTSAVTQNIPAATQHIPAAAQHTSAAAQYHPQQFPRQFARQFAPQLQQHVAPGSGNPASYHSASVHPQGRFQAPQLLPRVRPGNGNGNSAASHNGGAQPQGGSQAPRLPQLPQRVALSNGGPASYYSAGMQTQGGPQAQQVPSPIAAAGQSLAEQVRLIAERAERTGEHFRLHQVLQLLKDIGRGETDDRVNGGGILGATLKAPSREIAGQGAWVWYDQFKDMFPDMATHLTATEFGYILRGLQAADISIDYPLIRPFVINFVRALHLRRENDQRFESVLSTGVIDVNELVTMIVNARNEARSVRGALAPVEDTEDNRQLTTQGSLRARL